MLVVKSTFALAKKPSKLVFTLNKVSNVTLTMPRQARAHALGALRLRAPRALPSVARQRALAVRLRAVDLAGNVGAIAGRIAVRAR